MNPTILTLIINIVLLAFIALGFLFGLKGLKKSTFNLVLFIIQLVVVFILTPFISKLLLGISISGKTINTHIIDAVTNVIGAENASSAFVQDIIKSIPIMVVNIVTTILLIIALGLIFKLIGLIVYKLMFKKDAEKVVEKCEIVNGAPQMVKTTVKKKKHRLAGGLVGALHGFLLALVLFMPLCGIVNVFNDVAGVSEVSAETQTSSELKPFKDLLQENLPKEILDYAKAVDDSILFKIGKIGNISEISLNMVSKSDINGSSVSLGNELRTIAKTYDSFVDFALSSASTLSDYSLNTIVNDLIENPQNYNFDKLYSTVDLLFESNIVNALGKDALKFVADLMVEGANGEQEIAIANHIKTAIYNYAESNHSLKDEINSVIGVFEVSLKSGLVDALTQEQITVESLSSILLNNADPSINLQKNDVLKKICNKLTGSYLLQKFVLEFTNYGIENLEVIMNENLEFSDGKSVTLTKIDSSSDYTIKALELENLVENGLDLYEIVEGLDTTAIEADFYNIFDMDLESLVNTTGRTLNSIVNMSILKDTGVFGSICDAMAKTEYNNYIDFVLLKSENTITTQFNYLAQAVGELKDSGVINTIRYLTDENQNDSINELIDKLATEYDGKTYIARIVTPVLNCNLFKNAFEYALDNAHDFIETQLKELNQEASIHEFNTTGLMTENENAQLINVLNNLVQYMADIDVADLTAEDFVETIIYSDLNKVGRALEAIRTSNLFKDYDEHQGVYNDIMDALSGTDFANYFDFKVAKSNNFSWTTATEKLISIRDELDAVTITTDDGEVKLLNYILTNSNLDTLIQKLQNKTVNLQGVFELELIKPIAIKVVNLINAEIKNFVSEEAGVNIVDIDAEANLIIQAENINNIINKALEIDFNNIDINSLDDETLTTVKELLALFETNAEITENEAYIGVFKESYNALLIEVVNTINTEIKNFVGDALGLGIEALDGTTDITAQKDSIVLVLENALKIELANVDLDTISDEDKTKLNNLLDAMQANAINLEYEGVFKQSYNALLIKTVNLINENIKTIVGEEGAGIEITTISLPVEALTSYAEIREILNTVMNLAGDFKAVDVKTLNTDDLFTLIDIFKNNSTILDGVFAQTYNAMLVYAANTINLEVAEAVGEEYSATIETFTGETDVTASYNYIKEVIESGVDAFSSITDEQKIEDVESTKLDRFTTALNSNIYTRGAYTAVTNYLTGLISY